MLGLPCITVWVGDSGGPVPVRPVARTDRHSLLIWRPRVMLCPNNILSKKAPVGSFPAVAAIKRLGAFSHVDREESTPAIRTSRNHRPGLSSASPIENWIETASRWQRGLPDR